MQGEINSTTRIVCRIKVDGVQGLQLHPWNRVPLKNRKRNPPTRMIPYDLSGAMETGVVDGAGAANRRFAWPPESGGLAAEQIESPVRQTRSGDTAG